MSDNDIIGYTADGGVFCLACSALKGYDLPGAVDHYGEEPLPIEGRKVAGESTACDCCCQSIVVGQWEDVVDILLSEGHLADDIEGAVVSLINAGRCQHGFADPDAEEGSLICQSDLEHLRAQLDVEPDSYRFGAYDESSDSLRALDLRDLSAAQLEALRDEAGAHGDLDAVRSINYILRRRAANV